MKIETEQYIKQEELLPVGGKHIIGNYNDESIIVYQAFNEKIADYAVKHQTFGGNSFSFKRMTWIKPNFLWMMYRAGWASKVNQERILAIKISKEGFIKILEEAVHSTFKSHIYGSEEEWKKALQRSDVRLQWDPYHDPFGAKKERKAIQLGLRNDFVKQYCEEWIIEIEDITDYVKQEKATLDSKRVSHIHIPVERVFDNLDEELKRKLDIIA